MKVGDYVRTECGIAKIKSFETKNKEIINLDKDIMICNMDCYRNTCTIKQIIKSSPNIIDLIEVGDYVNGMLVTNIWIDKETGNIEFEFNNHESYLYPKSWNYESRITKYKIKSIVTKEQFVKMEYKVGDE